MLILYVCVCAQSCLTLCNLMDYSPPGSTVHEIFQGTILEQIAISFSMGIFLTQRLNHLSYLFCIGRWILYNCTTWVANAVINLLYIIYIMCA